MRVGANAKPVLAPATQVARPLAMRTITPLRQMIQLQKRSTAKPAARKALQVCAAASFSNGAGEAGLQKGGTEVGACGGSSGQAKGLKVAAYIFLWCVMSCVVVLMKHAPGPSQMSIISPAASLICIARILSTCCTISRKKFLKIFVSAIACRYGEYLLHVAAVICAWASVSLRCRFRVPYESPFFAASQRKCSPEVE